MLSIKKNKPEFSNITKTIKFVIFFLLNFLNFKILKILKLFISIKHIYCIKI